MCRDRNGGGKESSGDYFPTFNCGVILCICSSQGVSSDTTSSYEWDATDFQIFRVNEISIHMAIVYITIHRLSVVPDEIN